MINDNIPSDLSVGQGGLTLSYNFSESEIKLLARFFRNHQENLPDGLLEFSNKIERAIYNSMSIDEAQAFYS